MCEQCEREEEALYDGLCGECYVAQSVRDHQAEQEAVARCLAHRYDEDE